MGLWKRMTDALELLDLAPGFDVCELGDQMVTYITPHIPAKQFYKSLGCRRYISIDGNGRATVLADLNKPLPKAVVMRGKNSKPQELGTFDLVTDFGTGEHVFDQAQVWRTLHNLSSVGGYIALIRPEQGYTNHGFYNTHETLFWDIAFANHYEVLRLDHITATRGENIFVIYRRSKDGDFEVPQQGRYQKSLEPLRSQAC